MAIYKYINIDEFNKILCKDRRETFTKHEVWDLLNCTEGLTIDVEPENVPWNKSEKEFNKIKNTLIEANRYNDILKILKEIISTEYETLCTNIYIGKDGKAKGYVDGIAVRTEANYLYHMITLTDEDMKQYIEDVPITHTSFDNLLRYVTYATDELLHNYSVQLSHGREQDCDKMNIIKCWEILNSLLYNLYDAIEGYWTIPKGWKSYSCRNCRCLYKTCINKEE